MLDKIAEMVQTTAEKISNADREEVKTVIVLTGSTILGLVIGQIIGKGLESLANGSK